MDKIILSQGLFFTHIGISEKERKKKRKIFVDVELFVNIRKAARTDDIQDTVNYSLVHTTIKKLMNKKQYHLLESLAERISTELLQQFPLQKVLVRVKKPLPYKNIGYAAVEIVRK
ncbi:dihydroneopterin aldolase [Candidatus Woesearchaeota archaeon]|nr:dihydroneopterin aldolase [Candidatus Woesearchaeota archaeon]